MGRSVSYKVEAPYVAIAPYRIPRDTYREGGLSLKLQQSLCGIASETGNLLVMSEVFEGALNEAVQS